MFNQIGSLNAIGAPLFPNQVGGEFFIRHIGNDKLIFDFKSGSGTTVKDRSRENNDGTFGAGAAVPTWRRNSLYFDGGDYVDLDSKISDFASLTEGTIIIIFKSSTDANQRIFSAADKSDAGNDIAITLRNGIVLNKIQFIVREAGNLLNFSTNDTGFNDGVLHFVSITVGSSGNFMCIDGSKVEVTYGDGSATTQAFFNSVNDIDVLRLGNNEDANGNELYLTGSIKQSVRVLSKPLSQIEIQQNFLVNKFSANN